MRYEIRLPMSDAAFDRMHTLRVRRLWCGWLGGLGVLVSGVLWWQPALAVAVLAASVLSLVTAAQAHVTLPWSHPSAIADRRGRTVTLRGVHPAFAAAVAARR